MLVSVVCPGYVLDSWELWILNNYNCISAFMCLTQLNKEVKKQHQYLLPLFLLPTSQIYRIFFLEYSASCEHSPPHWMLRMEYSRWNNPWMTRLWSTTTPNRCITTVFSFFFIVQLKKISRDRNFLICLN